MRNLLNRQLDLHVHMIAKPRPSAKVANIARGFERFTVSTASQCLNCIVQFGLTAQLALETLLELTKTKTRCSNDTSTSNSCCSFFRCRFWTTNEICSLSCTSTQHAPEQYFCVPQAHHTASAPCRNFFGTTDRRTSGSVDPYRTNNSQHLQRHVNGLA